MAANPLESIRDAATKQAGEPDAGEGGAQFIKDRLEKGLKAARPYVHDYWLNHAFVLSHQWLYYNRSVARLDEIPHDPDRVMATVNRIWPASRTTMSKIMQRELTFEVMPDAADDATLRGAAMGESILEDVRHTHDWESLREELAWAAWKGGTAAICVDWDPKAGEPSIPGPTNADEPAPDGDTCETVLSVADMVWEPGHKQPEYARWWIKVEALPPGDVQATYDLGKEPTADATAGMTPFQAKLLKAHHAGSDDGTEVDLTLVLTYYERPNKQRKKGRIAVVVEDKIVFDGEWPFPFKDRLNFALARETVVERRGFGETVMTTARPVQVAYNASWSAIIEHMKLAGNARLLMPQSSMDLLNDLSDLPGEAIAYADGTEKPDYLSPPTMPDWWIRQPELLAEQMDDILGVHEVSRGTMPANIESGYGLSILAEQDSTPVGRMSKEIAGVFGRVATMVLKLYESMVDTTRQAAIRTPGQPPETAQWTGKDLMGQTSAQVPLEAVLPRSRAAMMAAAEKMTQMGLITSPEVFYAVAELPGQRDFLERMSPDVAKARRENHSLALKKACVPAAFDDHASHIKEHNVFRKSARYDMLDEEAQGLFDLHVQGHETRAAEELGRQRTKAAIDPLLATAPDKDGNATLPPESLPPGGGEPMGPGGPPMPEGAPAPEGEMPPGGEAPPTGGEPAAGEMPPGAM